MVTPLSIGDPGALCWRSHRRHERSAQLVSGTETGPASLGAEDNDPRNSDGLVDRGQLVGGAG